MFKQSKAFSGFAVDDLIPFWKAQYQMVGQSRKVLLEYCSSISKENLLQENSAFGRGSIRNLLVHIANTYEFWIGRHALQQEMVFTPYPAKTSIAEIISLFDAIDQLMARFFDHVAKTNIGAIDFEIGGKKGQTSPLQLFTHVITHEFHHKGQILSLSRHLGYLPVDTDVMR